MEYLSYFYRKSLVTIGRTMLYYFVPISPKPDETVQIPSRDAGRAIKAYIYRPRESKGPSPILINFHGSGFILPCHGSDDEFCRYVASKTLYTVLDVDYRKAPGNPYPAATNDAEDAVKWVLSQPAAYDASHMAISGFSAGGNLALVMSSTVFPPGTFSAALAFYPLLDLAQDPTTKTSPIPSKTAFPVVILRLFNACYVPTGINVEDPHVSPAFASPTTFPPKILFITADRDNLAPEAEALADRIKEVPGCEVVQRRMEMCDHGFDKQPKEGTPAEIGRDLAYGMAIDILQF